MTMHYLIKKLRSIKKNIFQSQELQENSVCREFRQTASDGKDYTTKYYNPDAVISIGF